MIFLVKTYTIVSNWSLVARMLVVENRLFAITLLIVVIAVIVVFTIVLIGVGIHHKRHIEQLNSLRDDEELLLKAMNYDKRKVSKFLKTKKETVILPNGNKVCHFCGYINKPGKKCSCCGKPLDR